MKLRNFYIFIAAVLAITSCTDDALLKIDLEKNRGKEVNFSAQIKKENLTRTYFGSTPNYGTDGKITSWPLYWASDDRIVVGSPMGMEGRQQAVYDIKVPLNEAGLPQEDLASYADKITLDTNPEANPSGAGVQWGSEKTGQFYAIYPFRAQTIRRPQNAGFLNSYYNTIQLPESSNGASAKATALVEPKQRIWSNKSTLPGTVMTETDKDGNIINDDDGNPLTYHFINMHGSNHANVMWAMTTNVTNKEDETVDLHFTPLSTCLMLRFKNGRTPVGTVKPAMIDSIEIIAPEGENIAGIMDIQFPKINDNTDGSKTQKPNGGSATCTLNTTAEESKTYNSNVITILPWVQAYTVNPDGSTTGTENGIHPTLQPGDEMLVEAFLLPTKDWEINSSWTIKVNINGKTFSRPLIPEGNTQKLLKGQIHEIDYPAFYIDYEWDYDPEHWMQDIPNPTYLTQLTFPGSWYSYCRDENSSNPNKEPYQSLNLAGQIKAGVRAFDISTRVGYYNGGSVLGTKGVVISGTGSAQGNEYSNAKSFTDALQSIITNLRTCGVLNTYNSNGTIASQGSGTAVVCIGIEGGVMRGTYDENKKEWLSLLQSTYGSWDSGNTYKRSIYGFDAINEKISQETTLGDVRGRLILKINIDADNEFYTNSGNVSTTGDAISIPGLTSFGTYNWLTNLYEVSGSTLTQYPSQKLTTTSLTTQMYWKKWHDSWNATLIGGVDEREETWAFNWSCTNRTSTNEGALPEKTWNGTDSIPNSAYIPSYNVRKKALTTLEQESKDVYEAGYHNEWFMFGFGGVQATNSTDGTDDDAPLQYAGTYTGGTEADKITAGGMNKYALDMIQSYFDNNIPCPMGIVFVNQIGTPKVTYTWTTRQTSYPFSEITHTREYDVYGDQILAKLIKMNSAFRLQQRTTSGSDNVQSGNTGSDTQSGQQNVQSAAPNNASGFKVENAGNGWSVL